MVFLKKLQTAKRDLYKNVKAIVCLLDGYTDFFDIDTGVLQENTLT